ncbi:Cysteine proteinase inhibitor [Melia azedarach]|uniref:Cysteine proteinase inhibitor n=1 Tax=Melia azedarach TaxID=155640 RepID=A0ACC1YHZ2_MELAZ|nr:Cysteine proteinase inhibitor [Melia azedarach]
MAKPGGLRFTLLLFFIVFVGVESVNGYRGRMVGGISEVKDVKTNKEVQELGRFSVEEFNRKQTQQQDDGGGGCNEKLRFSQVVAAKKQVVAGLKYYLTVETTSEKGEPEMFNSVVVIKPWVHSKELLDFKPSRLLIL